MEHKGYEFLARLAIENKLDMNKEEDVKKILALFETRVKELGKSPTFVYGKRSENAFFELVKALDSVKLIKEEDTERIASKLDLKIPDWRIVTEDDEIFLVEVKNFAVKVSSRNTKKYWAYGLTQRYWNQLNTYSDIQSTPLKIAIFWKNWGMWSLNDLEAFKISGKRRKITFSEAVKNNQMYKLGDKSIGTSSPLSFRFIMEPRPMDPGRSQTRIKSRIIDVQMCSQGNVIYDKEMARLAYLLFWFGKWEVQGPNLIIEDRTFHGTEYIAKPFEETEEQGFDIIANLSMMYMNMYYLQTHRGRSLPGVFPRRGLPKISKIIPENPFHRGLPLWIFTVMSSSA